MMTVLLTGASGFVGGAVLEAAKIRALKIRPVYRSIDSAKAEVEANFVSGLDSTTDWSTVLHGVDVVIHAAARAHIMNDKAIDPLAEYCRVNTEGTLNLARQAAAAGVRRFLFISSIKVNGEFTLPGIPFTADDNPAPYDAYGFSKAEAEVQLKQLAWETGMEVTIIRPPMIYGLGAKGNFAYMVSWIRWGLPIPLGALIQNRRSLVGMDNLVDLIMVCIDHPKAANQTFLVSDGEDLSTAELIRRIGKALKQPARLVGVPAAVISFIAVLIGKTEFSQRLKSSLQVDIQKTCEMLDWKPLVSVDEGLRKAVG